MRARRCTLLAVLLLAGALVGCTGSGDDATKADDTAAPSPRTIRVPGDQPTIAEAVAAADPGDLVLVSAGTYHESVDVTTPDITIRGVDRNEVILDGRFELENGLRVLETDGVVVENMTARNYLQSGFFWTGSKRFRASYLTAYRVGQYPFYAFDSYQGQFDHSYGSGSGDASFYVGECFRCDIVLDQVIGEHSSAGYSGTNSGGDVYIVRSTFRNNRVGMIPNSGSYELCYPGRQVTIVGNTIEDNNATDTSALDMQLLLQGTGIALAGAVDSTVERNLVVGHRRAGIALVPFPEADANAEPPPVDELDRPCSDTRDDPLPNEPVGLVVWDAERNRIIGNDISDSGTADLLVSTLPADGPAIEALGNCFSDNTYDTTSPLDLEALAPCDGEGSGGDFSRGSFDIATLALEQPPAPDPDTYRQSPVPEPQPNMPGPVTEGHVRATAPRHPDIDAIPLPRPQGS
jgi:hypothetical protein